MIKTYFSCTEPTIVIHRNPNCAKAKVGPENRTRHVMVNPGFLSRELERFRNNKHPFSAEPGLNDLWVIVDLQDQEFEMALVDHLKRIIALEYDFMKNCETKVHC